MKSREVRGADIILDVLGSAGMAIQDLDDFNKDLKSGLPNPNNLMELTDGKRQERLFAADGMPLFGVYPNSYDHAPDRFARSFAPYPRQDSPSRQQASANGARINQGAYEHIGSIYGDMTSLLRSIVAARRNMAGAPVEEDRDLSSAEALDVMNTTVSMWSYMLYRKVGRIPKTKIPAEVGMLNRSMSGVRMSLLNLFIHDREHGFERIEGWQDQPFSADVWARAVEQSGKLIGTEGSPIQVCPAPTAMIRKILETVVDPPQADADVTDLEAKYNIVPGTLLDYSRAWFDLETASARQTRLATKLMAYIGLFFEGQEIIKQSEIEQLKGAISIAEGTNITAINQDINSSFLRAARILGYDPEVFKNKYPVT